MAPDPDGPAAMGTKIHEVVVTSGREYVADTIVTEFDPETSYRFTATGTIGGLSGGRSVEARDDASAVFTYNIELEPQGKMRLLRPVLGPMVRSSLPPSGHMPREIAVGPLGRHRDESPGYRGIEKPRRSGAFP